MKSRFRRWLILTQYYPPEIGAPQIRLSCMAKELRKHGIQVEVLTAMPNYPAGKVFSDYRGHWKLREKIEGVSVRRTWIYGATGRSPLPRLLNYFSFTFTSLLSALFGPRPDVIFVESQPLSLGAVALAMKWLRGVPYIYNVPDLQVDVAGQLGFIRSRLILRLALGLENLFLKKAWKISTVTHGFISSFEARGLPASKITFLPNGADTDFLLPREAALELRERWKVEKRKVFIYVGTHAFYHGLDTLLDAATLLKEESDIVFLMIGDGPEKARLQALAVERGLTNVIFGRSPYTEMPRLYSIAYASVATLRKMEVADHMRLSKVFPSLACGVPVIYAGQGESADLVKEHRCGIVVEAENPSSLARAVRWLASNTASREQMGKKGRTLVENDYSWSRIVTAWLCQLGVEVECPRPSHAFGWQRGT